MSSAGTRSRPPAVEARGLTVRAGSRVLLRDADLSLSEGEILLLAGPSGSGKTVFLRLLAGLLVPGDPGFGLAGSLRVLGGDVLAGPGSSRGRVGVVFQDHALFTGLTAAANVAFALDHRPEGAGEETPESLLDSLGIPADAPVAELSGGQRQRVAIARAVAYAPSLIVWDEPTSGLDPALRDRVGELIRETRDARGAATVVVTHDLAGLLPIADRVVLLDPKDARFRAVDPAEAEARLLATAVPPPGPRPRRTWAGRALRALARFLDGTVGTLQGLGDALWHLVPRWRSPRWGVRFLSRYLKLVAGPGALLYFLLAGVVVGFVSTYFVFTFLPRPEYTKPLILDDLIAGLGFGLHRILVPLILTVLLAARAGAAASADISTRVAGRQLEAMRSLGARPSRYLLTGLLWAFLLGAPVLALSSFLGARVASAAVFAAMAPDVSLSAWSGMFHRLLLGPGEWIPAGTGWVAAKVLTSAFGIAAIAWFLGGRPKDSPEDVARAITATVIAATVLVLVIHLAFALVEFR